LRSAVLAAALLHGTRAVGVSQTLRRGIFTRQGGRPVRHWAVELPIVYLHNVIETKLAVVKTTALEQQISKFYLQTSYLSVSGQ